MQQLVMDVTGRPFPEFLKETVLDKIGMRHSGYLHPLPKSLWSEAAVAYGFDGTAIKGNWHIYPELAAAGLWTTPSDLARFAIEIQESLAGKSNKVLSQEMTRQMLTVQKGDYGLGLALAGTGKAANFRHGGSNAGYRCQLMAYTETGQGAVVMTDSDGGNALSDEILRGIAREYGWPDYHPVEKVVAQLDPTIYSSYAGEYEAPQVGKIIVSTDQSHFFVEAEVLGSGKTELFPESEVQFFATSANLSIGFSKDPIGSVVEMVVQMGGQSIKARKIK
jgi:CubicO group peptidase (beta-lactamase class C family)